MPDSPYNKKIGIFPALRKNFKGGEKSTVKIFQYEYATGSLIVSTVWFFFRIVFVPISSLSHVVPGSVILIPFL
jgi:hypothetical protein